MAKQINTMRDENGMIEGAAIIVINTGGAAAFQEMICGIAYVANSLRQLEMEKYNAAMKHVRRKTRSPENISR